MKQTFSLQLSPEEAYDDLLFKQAVLKKAGVPASTAQTFARQTRRSIDARGRKVLVNVEAELFINESHIIHQANIEIEVLGVRPLRQVPEHKTYRNQPHRRHT